jgi:hypothetical protein
MYNPSNKYFGNTVLAQSAATGHCPPRENIDWIYTKHAHYDLRMAAVSCT